MILLRPENYHHARALLLTMKMNNLYARSVVEHHVAGRVYVDDVSCPRVFHVVHPYGMSLLFGEAGDEYLQNHLKGYMLNSNGLRTAPEYMQIFPSERESVIDRVLGKSLCVFSGNEVPECKVMKYRRVNFRFNPAGFASYMKSIDTEEHSFLRVDERMFNENKGSVVAGRFWNNAADFLKNGVGFALMQEGRAAATAFSACCHDNMLELGIETELEFRNRGFAAMVSARLIQYCLEKDLEPVWACLASNQGSLNLALKLGFEVVKYLPCYHCR